MAISRDSVFTLTATLISVLVSAPLYASPLPFGVLGSPIDLSANVSESILPGGMVFQDSKPLFGTAPDPKQSAQLLHLSEKGVNASGRSTNIDKAFASSLAESNGNGGVGVSQTIFGSPGNTGQNVVRQLASQSLWTQTFVYNGTPTVDLTLHLQIPALQVQLLGVPPNRDNQSFTETATASASVRTVITHPDGSFSHGGGFDFGLREFETQIPDGTGTFLNFDDVDLIGTDGPLFATLRPNFVGAWNIDAVSTNVRLGTLHTGDTLAYVYTLTAAGTTHGFERGYDAFLGDPFGVDVVTNNLSVTVRPASAVAEPGTWMLLLPGLAGLVARRRG
jgi:hypothetical protein